ncbi:MAG: DUF6702 family protein [Thiohalospira sp.]
MTLLVKWAVCLITLMHPVHVSFTNVEYIEEKNEISVSFQIFIKDFELLFYHLFEVTLNLADQKSYNKYKNKTDQYFNHHFKFGSDTLTLENNGYKRTDEFTWFYYRIPLNGPLPDEVFVQNTVLFDLFFDQKNLLIYKNAGFEQGYQFDIRNKKILISLK